MSTHTDPLADALRALSQFLVADASMGETLHRVAYVTVTAISSVDFVGMSLLDERGTPTTPVYTSRESPEIDAAQYDSHRGPCLDAWRTTSVVRVDDISSAVTTYPEFVAAAAAHGVTSTLSLPLIAGDDGIGAMNLYTRSGHAFSVEDEALAAELATAASAVLANAAAYWGAYDLGQQMTTAMANRAVIEQAKGALMARHPGLSAEDAFALLARASQQDSVKLRDVAREVLDGTRDLTPNR